MIKKTLSRFLRAACGALVLHLALPAHLAHAGDRQLTPVRVAPGVYVVYGDPNPPSYDNDGLSVAVSNSTFAFGTRPANTWLPPDSSLLSNDSPMTENLVGKISTFTSGANTWTLSSTANGPDQTRAQWSTTSASGPWNDISAYSTDFTIVTGLAPSSSVTFYFRIQTPTSTSSLNQYSSTLTVTAQ